MDDISRKSLKSLTNTESSKPRGKEDRKGFNEDAGASLLHNYQEYWQELHLNLEENASKAQKADEVIGSVHSRLQNEHSALSDFTGEVSSLPELTEQIQDIISQISFLGEQMTSLENMLVTLEDMCEEGELNRNKTRHEAQLVTYGRSKALEIERAKVQLSKDHAKHVQAFESKLQRNLKERQEAFEATYREEIQNYKHTGQTKLRPNIAGAGPSLGDIDIGEDTAGLDDFLKSDDESPSDGPQSKERSESDDKSPSTNEDVPESQTPENPAQSTSPDMEESHVQAKSDASDKDKQDTSISSNNNTGDAKDEKESQPVTSHSSDTNNSTTENVT